MLSIDKKKFKKEHRYKALKGAKIAAENWRKKGYYARILKRQSNKKTIYVVYIKKR